jgi:hypothetical protein
MVAIARPGFCENRDRPMSKKLSTDAPAVVSGKVPAPVKVKLKRVNCNDIRTGSRLPNSGISEIAVNASLAFIEGAKPEGEIEGALVLQMACTHSAAMTVLGKFGGGGTERNIVAKASAAARLLRAYATQVEALRRLRNGGSQLVRVEHVHVNEGGQALIGNVKSTPGSGRLEDHGNG